MPGTIARPRAPVQSEQESIAAPCPGPDRAHVFIVVAFAPKSGFSACLKIAGSLQDRLSAKTKDAPR